MLALPDGTIGRAPYLLPYVDPSVRCGVPATGAIAFSVAVWARNAEVFATSRRTVADLPAPAAATLTCAGATATTSLADLCHHHATVLATFLPRPSP